MKEKEKPPDESKQGQEESCRFCINWQGTELSLLVIQIPATHLLRFALMALTVSEPRPAPPLHSAAPCITLLFSRPQHPLRWPPPDCTFIPVLMCPNQPLLRRFSLLARIEAHLQPGRRHIEAPTLLVDLISPNLELSVSEVEDHPFIILIVLFRNCNEGVARNSRHQPQSPSTLS